MKKTMILLTSITLITGIAGAQLVHLDPDIKSYQTVSGITGNLNSIGSDTLNNLMTFWSEGFNKLYPNIKIQIEGKGSSTAPPALIEGTAQLGPMSREMKSSEIDQFEKKFGYKPTLFKVAIDALGIFVHKDNPISGLTLQDLDNFFSSTYKQGGHNMDTWGDVNLGGAMKNLPITLYGRNSASGTYGFFKELVLNKGDFKPTVKEQPGSSSVVQGIASELGAIGYSGIGYLTSGVKTVPLGNSMGSYYTPSYVNCLNGDYPLARFLLIYVNKQPNQPLDKLTAEFLKYIFSRQGQEIVIKDGYFPLPLEIVNEAKSQL